MTKLISGRVKKIPSANVSASRYDFLKLSEAEPDLGLPAANGYVLSGNVDGTRRWVLPAAVATAAENANVANTVLSISNFTTANLAEGVNLYYTNARVYANVIGLLNAKANVLDLTTANVVELTNLYYTNARVDSYVTPKLTTANVIESASNLYYTNARVQNYLERVDGNILPISSGPYDIGSETHAWRDLWLQGTSVKFVNSGSLSAQSNTFTITDARGNVVFTANATNIPITSPDGKLSASLLSGVVNYSTSNVAEGSNLYYTNARVDSYVTPKLTTANVVESASNLYYTESRANTAIDNRVTKTFVENLGISVNTATFAQTANVANTVLSLNNFTTANLVEDTNLYYTNTRVYSNVIGLINVKANVGDLTTSNVVELNNLYYTNARVISAVTPYLTTANVIESAGNLYYTVARANTAIDNRVTKAFIDNLGISSNTATFAETANVANTVLSISNFTTSNLTEGTNLYYTNARVYSNVIGLINVKANISDLTTANVTEIGNNIFYTNARVYANVSAILPYYTGNLSAGNILANTIVATGGSSGTISATTDFSISAGSNINLIAPNTFANNLTVNRITSNIWTGLYAANIVGLTTANVTELDNLYYTNARVYSNVIGLLNAKANIADLTTANVAELNNLYYTNARVYSNVIGLLDAKANVTDLNTSNIIEGNNLYFTNARVLAGLVTSNLVVNDATVLGNLYVEGDVVTLNTATLSIEDKNIVLANGAINSTAADGAGINIAGAQANLKYRNTGDKFEFNKSLDVLGTITANAWGGLYAANIIGLTTANVAELTNLYYTNNRVYSNVVSILPTYTGNVAAGNVTIGSGTGGSLIGANLISATYISATNWTGIYTANVVESPGNLYYTNARAYANLTSASINALADVDTVTLTPSPGQALLWNGAAWVPNTITISAVELANVANTVVQIASSALVANTAIFAQNANIANIVLSISNFTTSNLAEGNNLYYTNARVYSNVIGLLNAKANVSDLTTANVIESAGNLYYTITRANTAIDARVNKAFVENLNINVPNAGHATSADSATTAGFATTAGSAGTVDSISNFTTTDLAEGNNLYYTNARVYSNVIGLINVKANVSDLTTSNVVELNNLYYTNARVYSNVIGLLNAKANVVDLTTSNVVEGDNLYYTNARVYSNVISILTNYATISNLSLKANVVDLTTANVIESASNLYYTITRANAAIDARVNKAFVESLGITTNTAVFAETSNVANTVLSIGNFTTSNLAEGTNLYYSNDRVYSNVIGLINVKANVSDLTTANVIEFTNLYYTNARVYSNVIGLLNAKANVVDLTTSNVVEGNNLYYTNARARTAISAGDTSIIYDPVAGTIKANATITAAIENQVNNLSTSTVTEGTNLYYTNARVYSNVIALLPTLAGTGIAIEANGQIRSTTTAGSITGLNTANVTESASNLYYTNTRARAAISAGTGVIYDNNTGVISIGQNVDTHANVTFADLTVTGNLNVVGNVVGFYANTLIVNDPLIQLGYGNPSDSFDLGFLGHYNDSGTERHAGLFRDATDKKFKFFDNITGEPTSTTVDTANTTFRLANVVATTFEGNVVGNVTGFVSSISNFTTTNLSEGNNLYYTNARVDSYITPKLTTANVVELTNLYYTNARVYSNVIGLLNLKANISDLTTSNVAEVGNNLYYTNARVYANVLALLPTYTGNVGAGNVNIGGTSGGFITGANLISTNVISATTWTGLYASNIIGLTTANVSELNNLYYTNARVYSNVIGLLNNLATAANLNLKANVADLTTANVTELNNLYYTNARVYSNVIATLPTYTGNVNAGNVIANVIIGQGGGFITGANLISTNIISATTWTGLYAANVIGLTTANVTELNNLYYTNARVYSNVIGLLNNLATAANLNLKANVVDLTTANVTELNNLYYTNARVYSNVASLLSTYAGNITAGNITTNVLLGQGGGSITGANLISTNIISATTWTGLYASNVLGLTTSNVTELNNLYYTNTRVYSNVIALLQTLAGNNIIIAANGQISANLAAAGGGAASSVLANGVIGLNTANVNEFGSNLYYTNARVYSNVIGLLNNLNLATTANLNLKANVSDLTTANVTELTNLYYTNARVYSNVIGLLNVKANVSDLTTANVTELTNLYYTNARVYSNVISLLPTYTGNINAGNIITNVMLGQGGGSITGANLISTNIISATTWTGLYASNVLGLNTANVSELTNLYYTNARVYSNVIGLLNNLATAANLNLKANVVDLTTANVTESPSNLYYTNARVIAGLVGQDVTVNNVTIRGDLIVEGNTVTLNTATVIVEDKNIILANGAINAAAADGAGLNIIGAQANLTYRNTGDKFEFNKSLDVLGTVTANSWGNLYAANVIGLTTANVTELTNLYYTNARTYSNVLALLPTLAGSGISIAANGQISSVSTAPNVLSIVGLNTANVAESASNLYYTNARVYSNVVAMLPNVGVRIASSFQQFVANGAATVFTLSTSITDATSIFVIIDGLTQIPTLDYTAANTTLTLLSTPVNQSNVVVRYFSAVLVP